MLSLASQPVAQRPRQAGHAGLRVSHVAGESAVTECWAASPLKLLAPRFRGPSVWAYISSFGGGLVAGDETSLEVEIEAGATCFLSTQASTKVYRNPKLLPCQHRMRAEVGEGGLLVLAPDPVQCFAQAIYEQKQEFHLAGDAGLVLVDWLNSGRAARGERWEFTRYLSRNEIFQADKRVMLDALRLTAEAGTEDLLKQMGRFHCLATVAVVGPKLQGFAQALLADVAELPVLKRSDFAISASPLADGVLLRMAGVSTEQVGREIARRLSFVNPLLQDDPWARKW
ncbi:MAG TPA: urease accessory protein UreD [Verrucomicrobiae bacterium]